MNVRVDAWAWLPKEALGAQKLRRLRKMLVVYPRKLHPKSDPQPIRLYEETEFEIGIPRAFFFDFAKGTHNVSYRITEGHGWPGDISFTGKLRPAQVLAFADAKHYLASHLGGIIKAPGGFGKTVLACALIAELGVPTLVFVNKEPLKEQWLQSFSDFLPDAKVGTIQGPVCDFEDKHVVISMQQSIAQAPMGKYPDALWDWPGLLVFDECVDGSALIPTDQGLLPLHSIVAGEANSVLSFDGVRWGFRKVARRWKKGLKQALEIRTAKGRTLKVTPEHLVRTKRGWIKAEYLVVGDQILSPVDADAEASFRGPTFAADLANLSLDTKSELQPNLRGVWSMPGENSSIPTAWLTSYDCVESIRPAGNVEVYDLEVEGAHNFVANGLLVHNCHRTSAETWSQIPPKFRAKWRLGVTATPRRADGTENVFFYHMGEIMHTAKHGTLKPIIHRSSTRFTVARANAFTTDAMYLAYMQENVVRNRRIIKDVKAAIAKGRKILVLSKRRRHLEVLDEMIPSDISVGFCVGGVKGAKLEEAKKAQVLLATYQYVAEGFDVPALDTLLLAMPTPDPEQAIYRVTRQHPDKKPPVVVDYRDPRVKKFHRWGQRRDELYERLGWS